MMAILMGTYYGFFLPQIINQNIQYDVVVKQYVSPVMHLTFFWNAIVNPIVYAWMSTDFRNAFKSMLGLKSKSKFTRQKSMIGLSSVSAESESIPKNYA